VEAFLTCAASSNACYAATGGGALTFGRRKVFMRLSRARPKIPPKGGAMSDVPRHPDVLTAQQAVSYLHLDHAAGSPEAALRLLQRLTGEGRIHPLRWAKTHLYARPDLDAFVSAEVQALALTSDTGNDGNPHGNGHKGRN
jgi:hypothetical protein